MTNEVSRKKLSSVQLPTWDGAIDECLRQLQEYEAQASRLRVSLEYFQSRKESGDQFPGIDILKKKGLLLESETGATQN